MNWVIEDSEQEDELDSVLKPTEPLTQAQTTSVISDFTPYDIVVPATNLTSPISKYTAENSTSESIIVPFTSVAGPVKSKRPKPRPAYKGGAARTSSDAQDGSVASTVATAINQVSPRLEDDYPFIDPTFSLDIAERTRAHKRNTTGTSSVENDRARSSSSKKSKKTTDTLAPVGDVGNSNLRPVFDGAGPTEEDTILIGKARSNERKNCKKHSTIVSSDEEEPECASSKGNLDGMEVNQMKAKQSRSEEDKENEDMSPKLGPEKAPTAANPKSQVSTPRMPSRRDSMSALIRRVSSKVQSPLATPSSTYSPSPLAKSSRRTLSRIAPLHPNRRTPPPAPPRPPAPKKSKKMLDLEEKWEMELADTVEGWSCMGDDERAALRRAKRDTELGYED